MRRLVPLLILLSPALAAAHPQDLAYLELTSHGDQLTAALDVGAPALLGVAPLPPGTDLTPNGIAAAAPTLFAASLGGGTLTVEGQPCRWSAPMSEIDGVRLRIRAGATCEQAPGKVRLELPFLDEMPPTFQLIGRADLDGLHREFHGGPGRNAIDLQGPPPRTSAQAWAAIRHLFAPGAGLLAILAALAAALSGTIRERALTTAVLLAGMTAGGLAHRWFAFSAEPVQIAAAIGVFALAAELAWFASPTSRWRAALPAGLVLGLALVPSTRGIADGLAAAAVLLVCATAGLLIRRPRLVRSLGALMAVAAVITASMA